MTLKELFENEQPKGTDQDVTKEIEDYEVEPEEDETDLEEILAFPSKYSGYEDDFVIISFGEEFMVVDNEGNSYSIAVADDEENEEALELYNQIVDFFNDSENKLNFDEFIEQFQLDENEIEWFADFVIVDASDTLKDLLQQIR